MEKSSIKDQRIKGFYAYFEEFLWKLKARNLSPFGNPKEN